MLFICTFKDFVGLMRTIYLGDGSISYDKQIGRSKFTTPVKILNYVLAFYFLKKSVNLTTSFFLDKHCICRHKCDYSIVDMPRAARLDIFAFGKFDMFLLFKNSI